MVCATSKGAYAQTDQSLCWSIEYSMTVKLLTEQTLEFLILTGVCTCSFESTLVKLPHCWKSHAGAHISVTLPNNGCPNNVFFVLFCFLVINVFHRGAYWAPLRGSAPVLQGFCVCLCFVMHFFVSFLVLHSS